MEGNARTCHRHLLRSSEPRREKSTPQSPGTEAPSLTTKLHLEKQFPEFEAAAETNAQNSADKMTQVISSSGHDDMIHDAVLDYYGRRLATCSSDKTIKIFEIDGDQHRLTETLKGYEYTTQYIFCCSLHLHSNPRGNLPC